MQIESKKNRLPVSLIAAIIMAESSFNPNAISSANALGLMQVTRDTGDMYKASDLLIPEENIRVGAKHLSWLYYKVFSQDLTLALSAYNAGIGNVRKYENKIPPFNETREYIKKVKHYYTQYYALDRNK